MSPHDGFGAARRVGPPQVAEERAVEHHRVTVLPAPAGPHEGRAGPPPGVQHRPDRFGRDEGQVDERHEHRPHRRPVDDPEGGHQRGELALLGMRIPHHPDRGPQVGRPGGDRRMVAAGDDDDVVDPGRAQRRDDALDERPAARPRRQERLRPALHAGRGPSGEHDAGNHGLDLRLRRGRVATRPNGTLQFRPWTIPMSRFVASGAAPRWSCGTPAPGSRGRRNNSGSAQPATATSGPPTRR